MEFKARYGPWALVAGASEGIGQAWCRQLAARGLNVVMVARRAAPLEAEAEAIAQRYGVATRVLALDLGAPEVGDRIAAATADLDVGFLVYNAAHADVGEFLAQSLSGKLATIDVNCRGVLLLTSHFGPRLVARGRGGIVLMSSMSGWQGSAMIAVYAASKAFITVLGEGLWSELRPHGVDVQVCVAGATSTPNFNATTPTDRRHTAFPMEPEAVVVQALARIGGRPTVIVGAMNRFAYLLLSKLIPRALAVRFFSRTTRDIYGGS